jgi:hypothetical protein
MGMDPAYPAVLATHLCDDRGIRPVQIGRAGQEVRENFFHFSLRVSILGPSAPERCAHSALNQLSSVGTSRQGKGGIFHFCTPGIHPGSFDSHRSLNKMS